MSNTRSRNPRSQLQTAVAQLASVPEHARWRRSMATIWTARSAFALSQAQPAHRRSIICRLIVRRDCAGEAIVYPVSGTDRYLRAYFTDTVTCTRRRRARRRGRRCRTAIGLTPASPLAVRLVAISRVRLRESTQQLRIIARNREHNRGNAKSAESGAEPKHSHRKTPFEFIPFRVW